MFDDYMINTWIGATLVAFVSGLVGFFVVVRGASFAAHALPLSAVPGAAAASLFGIDPLYGLLGFSLLGIVGINALSRFGRRDLATALSLVMLLGLGALFLSRTTQYFQSIYALLFGEVLGISAQQLGPLAMLSAVCVGALVVLFRPLLLSSVATDLCEARGVSSNAIELAFLGLVGLATTVALPVVGALLVFSLTVGPASAARVLTDSPVRAMVLSAIFAMLTVWAAIALSYLSDLPIGFFVGMLSAACYGAGQLWLRRPRFGRAATAPLPDAA